MPGENSRIHKLEDKSQKHTHSPSRAQSEHLHQQEDAPSGANIPSHLRADDVLNLQGSLGNEAITRLIRSNKPGSRIQFKLIVGSANELGEQEADQMAEQVIKKPSLAVSDSPSPTTQREAEEVEEFQSEPQDPGESFEADQGVEEQLKSLEGSGSPLTENVQSFMGPRFGADFSDVHIHTGSESVQLNRAVKAQAFTQGKDIYFGEGQYNPGTDSGKQLLAHELTHVVQQSHQSGKPIQRWGIKALGGLGGLQGHETLTEVATENWEKKYKEKIEVLEKRKKREKGEAREKTEQEIKALEDILMSKEEKSGLVTGSRFNDMLHNATVIGLGIEIGKEGTLTHESHEGQLQFLHSMASKVAEQAWQTQHKIMMWAEFCYKVGTGNISISTKLKDVQIATENDFAGGPTIAKLFEAWGDQTVGWLFTGKSKESGQAQAPNIAIGSMLHMLQDSFCMSHAQREVAKRNDRTARLIKGFNVYTEQEGGITGRHGKADIVQGHGWTSGSERVKMTEGAEEAVEVSRKMIDFWQKHMSWNNVKTYLKSILGLSRELEAQRPTNGKWTEGEDPTGGRKVSASGRLFRKTLLIDQFKSVFGKKITNEPHEVFKVRAVLERYNALLARELKVLTVAYGPDRRAQLFLRPQDETIVEAMNLIPAAISKIDGWTRDEKKRSQYKGALNEIKAILFEDATEVKKDLSSIRSSKM